MLSAKGCIKTKDSKCSIGVIILIDLKSINSAKFLVGDCVQEYFV